MISKVYVLMWRYNCDAGAGVGFVFADKVLGELQLRLMREHENSKEWMLIEVEMVTLAVVA